MKETPAPLYRQGNATLPRMDNVRIGKDIVTFEKSGVIWVPANLPDGRSPGGVSTFSDLGTGKNWWRLEGGINIPDELELFNDHGNHWLWQPSRSMTIETYQNALRTIGSLFSKIN